MLTHMLDTAEAKSSVCRHEDGLHLGKYAHALPPIEEIRGQLSSATPERRIPGCPSQDSCKWQVALITLLQQPRCAAPARALIGVFLCLASFQDRRVRVSAILHAVLGLMQLVLRQK